ncbi:MAG TPA: hypothetical protein ENJ54_07570 [Chloroflexi bacterium]|nr:hypothetical protein [Chloroflexota bacterium]
MPVNRLRRLSPRVLLWLAPFFLLAPALRPGYALFWGTPALQFVPWHWWAWDVLRHGHLPLWNPLLGAGAPLAANDQSALFYPLNWLLVPFAALGGRVGLAWAHGLLAALHLALAGWGMAKVLDDFDAPEPAPTVAGLAYALSGYLVARLGFFSINAAAAWIPWLLWAARRVAERPTRRRVAGLAGLWGLQLLAGHTQTAWYTALLVGVWVLFWLRKPLKKRVAALAAAAFLGLALAAVQWLPTAVYLWQSQRAGGAPAWALDYSFWPWHFLTLLMPDAFGNPAHGNYWGYGAFWEDAVYLGMLPLLLAGLALRWGKPRRAVVWGGIVVVGGFVLALGKFTPVFMVLYRHVPTFAMFKAPARWLIWPETALALLGGLGVASWRRPRGRALYWTRLGTAGALAVALGAGLAWVLAGDVRLTMVRSAALAGFWALGVGLLALRAPQAASSSEKAAGVGLWPWAVALWVLADLLVAGGGLNPAARAQPLYGATPPEVRRVETLAAGGRVYLPPNDEERLKFKRFFRFDDFSPPPGGWESLRPALLPNLSLLDGLASANNFDPLLPARYVWYTMASAAQPPVARQRLWERLGVGAVGHVAAGPPYSVQWEALAAEPQARWVPRAVWVNAAGAAWGELARRARQGGAAWQCVVVLEGPPQPPEPACSTQWSVQRVAGTPQREVWEVQAPQDGGFVVFSETWYPGWQAWVDGQQVPLYRADYLFRAVPVPAGKHQIMLEYRPWWWPVGAAGSLLAVLALFVLWWRRRAKGFV